MQLPLRPRWCTLDGCSALHRRVRRLRRQLEVGLVDRRSEREQQQHLQQPQQRPPAPWRWKAGHLSVEHRIVHGHQQIEPPHIRRRSAWKPAASAELEFSSSHRVDGDEAPRGYEAAARGSDRLEPGQDQRGAGQRHLRPPGQLLQWRRLGFHQGRDQHEVRGNPGRNCEQRYIYGG